MFTLSPFHRLAAAAVVAMLLPQPAAAQDRSALRTPTIAASAAAAADWASTYYALKHFRVREMNPVLSPMQATPGPMISVGAVMDAGMVSAWNLSVGRKNERVAAAGLWAMTAFRAYLAIHNLRNTRKAERRVRPADRASRDAAATCAAPLSVQACEAAARTAQ
jgi:hypothetical protein